MHHWEYEYFDEKYDERQKVIQEMLKSDYERKKKEQEEYDYQVWLEENIECYNPRYYA
jgi:hypothetical protein